MVVSGVSDPSRVRMSGPVVEFMDGLVRELQTLGYATTTSTELMRLAAHLSRWLEASRLGLADLTSPVIDAFVVERRRSYVNLASAQGLDPILGYLRRVDAVPAPRPVLPTTAAQVTLAGFAEHLTCERGLSSPVAAVDFGTRPLEQAMHYPKSLAIVRRDVKPDREDRPELLAHWWQFWRPRPEMRQAVGDRTRCICSTLTGKRLLFVWADTSWCPSNATGVLAFDDDYSMGVLSSRAHGAWAWARSSTLKQDLRYTPSTAFDTFPWPPSPSERQREDVAEASRDLLALRDQLAAQDGIGLTQLYNAVDDGAYVSLSKAHRRLDAAVAGVYGWPRSAAQDDSDLVRRLGELNTAVATEAIPYTPF